MFPPWSTKILIINYQPSCLSLLPLAIRPSDWPASYYLLSSLPIENPLHYTLQIIYIEPSCTYLSRLLFRHPLAPQRSPNVVSPGSLTYSWFLGMSVLSNLCSSIATPPSKDRRHIVNAFFKSACSRAMPTDFDPTNSDQVSAPLLHIHNRSSPIQTPHIDALAAKSAVFSSAYCAAPLCAPARVSFLCWTLFWISEARKACPTWDQLERHLV